VLIIKPYTCYGFFKFKLSGDSINSNDHKIGNGALVVEHLPSKLSSWIQSPVQGGERERNLAIFICMYVHSSNEGRQELQTVKCNRDKLLECC
jgi:hypothetical protein